MKNRSIYKYVMPIMDEHVMELPAGTIIRHVDVQASLRQPGTYCIWAEVDPAEQVKRARKFRVVGTGHLQYRESSQRWIYLGSFQVEDGVLVFHVYEIAETPELGRRTNG